jgi:hypothetical protein
VTVGSRAPRSMGSVIDRAAPAVSFVDAVVNVDAIVVDVDGGRHQSYRPRRRDRWRRPSTGQRTVRRLMGCVIARAQPHPAIDGGCHRFWRVRARRHGRASRDRCPRPSIVAQKASVLATSSSMLMTLIIDVDGGRHQITRPQRCDRWGLPSIEPPAVPRSMTRVIKRGRQCREIDGGLHRS